MEKLLILTNGSKLASHKHSLLTSSVVQPPFILWLKLLIARRGKPWEILSCAMMSGRQTHERWGGGGGGELVLNHHNSQTCVEQPQSVSIPAICLLGILSSSTDKMLPRKGFAILRQVPSHVSTYHNVTSPHVRRSPPLRFHILGVVD